MGGDGFNLASYTDAVWLEGTAQMVVAYLSVKDVTSANYFINEVEKAIIPTSPSTQGLAYATNGGTGFWRFSHGLAPPIGQRGGLVFIREEPL